MEHTLFVNSCMREKNISRTYKLAYEFISFYKKQNPESIINEIELKSENLYSLKNEQIQMRSDLIEKGDLKNNEFKYANQFANADKIIIAAPFWDLSFPSILKIYIENISVLNIAFKYTEKGSVGLCKAKKLLFITTRGGTYINSPLSHLESGVDYIKSISIMFGIDSFDVLAAEGLDEIQNNPKEIMHEAINNAEVLARRW